MYIINGIAYAGGPKEDLKIIFLKILDNLYMLITFSTGEKRIFDATFLLKNPVYKPLSNREIFNTAKIEHGVLTWLNGDIDISPDTVYKKSFAYDETLIA